MLNVSRKAGEGLVINGQVEVKILEVKGKSVKIGVTSPSHMPVLRQEIFESIRAENAAAAMADPEQFRKLLDGFLKKPNGT